jgi:hypothetical protein
MKKPWLLAVLALVTLLCLWATQAGAQDLSSASSTLTVNSPDGGTPTSYNLNRSVSLIPNVGRSSLTPQAGSSGPDPKFEFFGGYSYLSNGFGGRGSNHGANIEATWNASHNVGFTADFSYNAGSTDNTVLGVKTDLDQDFYYLVFGPKLTHHAGNFQMYTHFLVGIAHGRFDTSAGGGFFTTGKDTNFAIMAGGGVDYMFSERWGWRVLEADYAFAHMSVGGFTGSVSNVRISTGPILRW